MTAIKVQHVLLPDFHDIKVAIDESFVTQQGVFDPFAKVLLVMDAVNGRCRAAVLAAHGRSWNR